MPYTFNPFTGSFDNTPTDSQTLSFNESNKNLSISNGNTVPLSALVDTTAVDTEVRALTANWQNTSTVVQGNSAQWASNVDTGVRALTANWESTYTTVLANSATWSAALTGVAQTIVASIVNVDSVTMNRGDVVYSFGATGNTMSVKLASNSGEATSSKTFGIINGTVAPNQIGYVTFLGQVDKLSLGAYNEGDTLWLGSTPGTFTNIKPVTPNHLVYIGVVERANNGNGIMYVRTQNGYEIEELHNVLVTSVSAGQILRRNNTNNLWINTNDGTKWDSVYTTVQSNSAIWGAVTSYSALIGDSVTNPLTATHNLNTKDIVFSVREASTNKIVYAAGRTISDNSLELTFNNTPSINQYDLTVLSKGGVGNNTSSTNFFALTTISSPIYIQSADYSHNLYDDSISTGQIIVYLLPPVNHIGVTQHKKIGSTASIVLSAPNDATIDGQSTYTLTNQYESIGIYTDGTNYFIE